MMKIKLSELLEGIDYINVNNAIEFDTNKNFVVFGSNGIGKTTIYHQLKNKYKDFDYLDYDETKDIFKKNKKKIEISLGINKLEELLIQITQYNEILSIQSRLKQKNISSKAKAQEVSSNLAKKYASKQFSKIEITEKEYKEIKSIDKYIKFILSNFESLKKTNDLSKELELVDQNYLKKVLSILEPKINEETKVCPVCGSKVLDLKTLINKKIRELSSIKNECLKKFVKEFDMKDSSLKTEFEKIINTVNELDENKLIDYFIIDGSFDTIKTINEAFAAKKRIQDVYEKCLKKQEDLFNSLLVQKEVYTAYLENNFNANVNFNSDKKLITIVFNRNVETFSTGEINLIMFITKLFSFLGSEKQLLVIDDPISSYDLVNQYHIVFHLCKIIMSSNKHVIVFTHNPDVINVINSQNDSAYQYYFFDKVNGQIIMNTLPSNMNKQANVLSISNLIKDISIESNKYLSLMMERDDEDPSDKLSGVLHYDDGIVTLGIESGEYVGCTNQYFINYIENEGYIRDLQDTDFVNLCRSKIILLTAIRIWVEFKLQELSCVKLYGLYANKVNNFFKRNNDIQQNYPNLIKEKLMNKKVMLNQNCHINSQIQPFYYALSVKLDDIKREIEEIKIMFQKA